MTRRYTESPVPSLDHLPYWLERVGLSEEGPTKFVSKFITSLRRSVLQRNHHGRILSRRYSPQHRELYAQEFAHHARMHAASQTHPLLERFIASDIARAAKEKPLGVLSGPAIRMPIIAPYEIDHHRHQKDT